jgi:L,D-transpeptidase ErfK/SrfK
MVSAMNRGATLGSHGNRYVRRIYNNLLLIVLFAHFLLKACTTPPAVQTSRAPDPGDGTIAAAITMSPLARGQTDPVLDAGGGSIPATASVFALAPGQTAVGTVKVYVTQPGDNLLDLARRYDLGYTQLITANHGIDPWSPGPGRRVLLPARYLLPQGPRRGIVINLAQQRLFYFPPDGKSVETYPIGTGVQGWSTPVSTTRIIKKDVHPTWYPPLSIRQERPWLVRMVPPGPDNPLGDFALRLGWPGYLIHGTNKPNAIGRNVTRGCIELYPKDIERIFHEVPVGTPVRVVDEEVQSAWIDGDLYVAVYPSKEQIDQLDTDMPMTRVQPSNLRERVADAAGGRLDRVDWHTVEAAGRSRTGIPVRVTLPFVGSD